MSPGKIVVGAVILGIAAFVGYCQARTTELNTAFAQVSVGDPERIVVAKMGRPHRVHEGCGYINNRPITGCVREYVYFSPFIIAEEGWSIAFNASGAVIDTAYFVSP